ncbi:MAG TPA: hypothetical protein EYP65_03335 [Armatimonadetes bacterium]|nr:hypothetical protein [Armatimonadota bacterium]
MWVSGRRSARKDYTIWLLPADYDAPAPFVERIYVFDPQGKVASLLEEVALRKVELLSSLSELPAGAKVVVVVGESSGGEEEISSLLERGGVAVFIEPSGELPALPGKLRPRRAEGKLGRAWLAGLKHPLVDGLWEEALRDWGGVGREVARLYLPREGTPVGRRDLVVAGTASDPAGLSLLSEFLVGQGKAIVCCLRVVELLGEHPPATRLLWDMLRLAQRAPLKPARVAEVMGPGGEERDGPYEAGLRVDWISSPEVLTRKAYDLLIVGSGVDWEALSGWRDRVREFVEDGGTALIFLPEEPIFADGFLPWALRAERAKAEGALKVDPEEPLLWGMTDIDLSEAFDGLPCFVDLAEHYRPLVLASTAQVQGPFGLLGLRPLPRAGWLVECRYGAGRYILCSAPLDAFWERSKGARRVLSALLANLGVSAKWQEGVRQG